MSTEEQTQQIESILKSCGIETVESIQSDEFGDNLYGEGSKGYLISTKNANKDVYKRQVCSKAYRGTLKTGSLDGTRRTRR